MLIVEFVGVVRGFRGLILGLCGHYSLPDSAHLILAHNAWANANPYELARLAASSSSSQTQACNCEGPKIERKSLGCPGLGGGGGEIEKSRVRGWNSLCSKISKHFRTFLIFFSSDEKFSNISIF